MELASKNKIYKQFLKNQFDLMKNYDPIFLECWYKLGFWRLCEMTIATQADFDSVSLLLCEMYHRYNPIQQIFNLHGNYNLRSTFNNIMKDVLRPKIMNGRCFIIRELKSNEIIHCVCIDDCYNENNENTIEKLETQIKPFYQLSSKNLINIAHFFELLSMLYCTKDICVWKELNCIEQYGVVAHTTFVAKNDKQNIISKYPLISEFINIIMQYFALNYANYKYTIAESTHPKIDSIAAMMNTKILNQIDCSVNSNIIFKNGTPIHYYIMNQIERYNNDYFYQELKLSLICFEKNQVNLGVKRFINQIEKQQNIYLFSKL